MVQNVPWEEGGCYAFVAMVLCRLRNFLPCKKGHLLGPHAEFTQDRPQFSDENFKGQFLYRMRQK